MRMNRIMFFAVLCSLSMIWGLTACHKSEKAPIENTPVADQANADPQIPAAEVSQNEPQAKDDQSNMVANAEQPDSDIVKAVEYVDIAEACRPGAGDQISAEDWAKANNAFGYQYLKTTSGNTVFSPYSIERAIGMTLDGACLSTADEMLKALEMPNAKRLSMSGHEVDLKLKNVNDNTLLNIENKIWPDKSLKLPDDYIARLKAGYEIDTISLDYKANPEKARIAINDDIAKATKDRIKDLLPKDSITNDTKLVLTNAVYFKSVWLNPFEESNTKKQKFYGDESEKEVDMMHWTGPGPVLSCDGYDLFDMAFDSKLTNDGGNYIFRIILPRVKNVTSKPDRMKALSLTETKLSNNFKECEYKNSKIHLSLPKFKLQPDTISIVEVMKSFGIKEAFTDDAKFYAMPNYAAKVDESPYLKITDIFHKAFIEIDEKGGEAAAATAVVKYAIPSSARPHRPEEIYNFTVDHPFIFVIYERSTNANLFVGRVTDL